MNDTFTALKSSRNSSLERLTKEINKLTTQSSSSQNDDRFWQPEVDKAGNGYAVIRFLPETKGEDLPWVMIWSHGFQGPGGWYIENSLTTLKQTDPVSELNSKLWNSGIESDKEIARKQKRKLTYISNIYVVSDPAHPENEGKVFLYKYGKKIFDKINEKMNPEFADEKPMNPYDFWNGANFKLKIRNVAGYRNYDKSEFDTPAPLFDDETKLETVWNSQHALKPFVSASNFKSYDELKARLDRVLAEPTNAKKQVEEDHGEEDSPPWKNTAEPKVGKTASPKSKAKVANADAEDEDMAFFEKLAAED